MRTRIGLRLRKHGQRPRRWRRDAGRGRGGGRRGRRIPGGPSGLARAGGGRAPGGHSRHGSLSAPVHGPGAQAAAPAGPAGRRGSHAGSRPPPDGSRRVSRRSRRSRPASPSRARPWPSRPPPSSPWAAITCTSTGCPRRRSPRSCATTVSPRRSAARTWPSRQPRSAPGPEPGWPVRSAVPLLPGPPAGWSPLPCSAAHPWHSCARPARPGKARAIPPDSGPDSSRFRTPAQSSRVSMPSGLWSGFSYWDTYHRIPGRMCNSLPGGQGGGRALPAQRSRGASVQMTGAGGPVG